LSTLGHDVIARYRAIERAAARITSDDLAALDAAQRTRPPAARATRRPPAPNPRHRSPLMPRRSRG